MRDLRGMLAYYQSQLNKLSIKNRPHALLMCARTFGIFCTDIGFNRFNRILGQEKGGMFSHGLQADHQML
jgi:hypothetical protein